jgi:HEAT repeat protein
MLLQPGSLFAEKMKNAAEYSVIHAGLMNTDREVRIAAAKAAGELADRQAIEPLKAIIANADESDTVKIKAAVALAKVGESSGAAELRRILANRPKISPNMNPLLRAKAIARGTIRAEAARSLGDIKDQNSIPLLREMQDDDDGRVVDASLIALAKLGDRSGKSNFISGLESNKQEIRAKAAEALGEIGDKDAVTVAGLRKRMKDWDRDSKTAAALALARLKDEESAPAIREMLWDKDETVRERAAQALGIMGSSATVGGLFELLKDPNGLVRITAAQSLHELGNDSGRDFLLSALKSEDKDARIRALNAFSAMATPKDIPALQPLLKDPDATVQIAAAKAVIKASPKK